MYYHSFKEDEAWPVNWMENSSHPSEDNVLFTKGKKQVEYFNLDRDYLRKKSKIEIVIEYLRVLFK